MIYLDGLPLLRIGPLSLHAAIQVAHVLHRMPFMKASTYKPAFAPIVEVIRR
jgi:hypothetical protein